LNVSHKQQPRVVTIFFFFCLLYSIIVARLCLLQLKNTHFFSKLGSQQYHLTVTHVPPRAAIVDRTGNNFLAINKDCISAFIVPNNMSEPERVHNFLKEQFPSAHERLLKHPSAQFMYIKRRLSDEQQHRIESANIPDLPLLHESSRYYPVPSLGPTIGITDIDNHGLMGIERHCEKQLAGTPTTQLLEKDARSGCYYFSKQTTVAGTQGSPIQLSIDCDLQFLAQQEVQATHQKHTAKCCSAIIMNPENGEILTLISTPHFDPNQTNEIDIQTTRDIPIADAHEPGSVMKIFAALAAIEENVVTPDEPIDCKNAKTAKVNGRTVNTVKAHGIIPFADVVAFSNNIGTATVSSRLGIMLYDHYTRLGFGEKSGIGLPGEHAGVVNPPHKWSKQSPLSLSYGYEIAATPLQIACAFCVIANNGHSVRPTIIMHAGENKTRKIEQPLYSPRSINTIKDILSRTVEHGTARAARINGYTVMSKTGTANLIERGNYNPHKNIFTCAGIVEKGDYRRVIVVSVREIEAVGKYASTVAAPLFGNIARKMVIHDRIV